MECFHTVSPHMSFLDEGMVYKSSVLVLFTRSGSRTKCNNIEVEHLSSFRMHLQLHINMVVDGWLWVSVCLKCVLWHLHYDGWLALPPL